MEIKGFTYGYDAKRGDFRTEGGIQSQELLYQTGVNWICLAVVNEQETAHSTTIAFDYGKSVSDRDVIAAVSRAHERQIKVCLKPMVNCKDGVWRAYINFADSDFDGQDIYWDKWFKSYGDYMKQPLYIIAGPTAAGKSALAVALAKKINGEVISGDSMQVYRGMDIGTAKITPEEMDGVPHHLIDCVDPWDEWNVAKFVELASAAIEDIASRGRVPIVAGGTGFYLHALAYGAEFEPEETASDCRRELETRAETEEGRAGLYDQLSVVDPAAAMAIHPNNIKRVIRALEYHLQTGGRISEHNEKQRAKESPYDLHFYVLNMDRERLYERIDLRVDLMIENGLIEEVRGLMEKGCDRSLVSMQGLGYKEIIAYLEGEVSLEEAVRVLKRDTRHFAKRQLTWFRREEATWITSVDEIKDLNR